MNLSKIKTYVGFAVKSRSIVYGIDSIKTKKVKLIIFSSSLSESAKDKCKILAKNNSCMFKELSEEEMIEILNNDKIKAIAIVNQDLANAIMNNF